MHLIGQPEGKSIPLLNDLTANDTYLAVGGHDGRRYEGHAPLGVSHLCWLRPEADPGFARPRATGWHLVKYSPSEARASLPGLGPQELERLRQEFGLLTDAEPGRPDEAFYASRAWAALVQWVIVHPKLAGRYGNDQAHLPGWHDRAREQAARACKAAPA